MTSEEVRNKQSAKGLRYLFGSQIINVVLGFTKTFIFALYIAPENFGFIALSASISGLIILLKDFGYSTYIIQKENISEKEIELINSRTIFLGLGAFLIICLVSLPVAHLYNQVRFYWILPIVGIQFIFSSFTVVPNAILRKELKFDKIAKIEIGANLFSILAGVLALFFCKNYWVLLSSTIFYFLVQTFLTYKYSSFTIKLVSPINNKIGKEGFHFGSHLTMFNVLTFLSVNIDNLIIGKIFGNVALGIYSKSYDFGVATLDKIRNPISQVYFSDLSLSKFKSKEMNNIFLKYMFLTLSILILVVGPALLGVNVIIDHFLGPSWSKMKYFLPPFFISSFIWMSMALADKLLLVTSKLKKYLLLGGIKSLIGMLAIIISAFWGATAIAWSFFIYHLIIFIPFCYQIFLETVVDKREARQLVYRTISITFAALGSVILPWLLFLFHIIDPSVAFLILIFEFILLHLVVWPSYMAYSMFHTFISEFKFSNAAKAH